MSEPYDTYPDTKRFDYVQRVGSDQIGMVVGEVYIKSVGYWIIAQHNDYCIQAKRG